MKKIALILFCALWLLSAAGIGATLKAVPGRPVSGEMFMLEVTVDSDRQFSVQLPGLPDGFRISRNSSSNSQNISIINGRRKVEIKRSFAARADRPGKYRIPPFILDFNGEKVATNELDLTIRDAADLPDNERISALLTLHPARPVYAGELIRADIELFIPSQWTLQGIEAIKPENFANGSFLTLPGKRGAFYQSANAIRRSGGYQWEFQGVCQVLSAGEFAAQCQLDLQVSKRSSGYDSFFAPPPTSRSIIAKAAVPLKVLARPAVPAGAVDTGLTGSWRISAQLSKKELRTGDIAELTLTFDGEMPAPGFRAPEVKIPDARSYPAEVSQDKSRDSYTVKYPFVALKEGKYQIDLPLAVLDPQNGKYVLTAPEIAYTVTKNPELAALPAPQIPAVSPGDPEKTALDAPQLLPPGQTLSLPLFDNFLPWAAGIMLTALAALAVSFLPRRKNAAAKKELRRLIAAVTAKGTGELTASGSAGIAAALGLPPGTTFAEIAEHCPDKETAAFFRELDSTAYNPDFTGSADTPELRQKVVKFLKKLLIFAVMVLAPAVYGVDYAAAQKAFYDGRYPEACEKFRALLDSETPGKADPALLYDLGCAEYMCGNYGKAYICFRRSSLLKPADRRFSGAVTMAESKLSVSLPEHPLLKQLGFIRPDIYLFMAVILLALLIFTIAFRSMISRGIITAAAIVFPVFAALCIAAAAVLAETRYDGKKAVVTAKDAQLSSIPADSGGKRTKLAEGTPVDICGESGNFVRVEGENISGWMKKNEVTGIFIYDLF